MPRTLIDDTDRDLRKHYRMLRIPMSIQQFRRLPSNGAYKHEYADGKALISPRPHFHDVYLELSDFEPAECRPHREWRVRPLAAKDWRQLPVLAAAAFYRVAPYATFTEEKCGQIQAAAMRATRKGADGKLLARACMVAETCGDGGRRGMIVGASLVTMRKGETNGGTRVPALTWIFVTPWFKRQGISSDMLTHSVRVLKKLGHSRMESVVCTANQATVMWHWQMGFKAGPSIRQKLMAREKEHGTSGPGD